MRAKKAKMIRRLARQMTVGRPERQYHERALNPKKPTRRTRFLYDCTRQVYQNIKKKYRDRTLVAG